MQVGSDNEGDKGDSDVEEPPPVVEKGGASDNTQVCCIEIYAV